MLMLDRTEMAKTLLLVQGGAENSRIPVAARLVSQDGTELSQATNHLMRHDDVMGHAELVCIQKFQTEYQQIPVSSLTIYVTLEPCPMCAWALRYFGIGKVVFGAFNPNYGAGGSVYDLLREPRGGMATIEVIGGVLEPECSSVIRSYFSDVR